MTRVNTTQLDGRLCQIALSVSDAERTLGFYQNLFGFQHTGHFYGESEDLDELLGLEKVINYCHWLVDGGPLIQLEVIAFERPIPLNRSDSRRPCDVGYQRMMIKVADFDDVMQRMKTHNITPLTAPQQFDGVRHACCKDPDGILVEIIESPQQDRPAAIAGVAASVADLSASIEAFEGVLGMQRQAQQVQRDSLWGMPEACGETVRLTSGEYWVELTEYTDPAPLPWPDDWQLSDIGILNIALCFRSLESLKTMHARVLQHGFQANSELKHWGDISVVYVYDPQGFSVELLRLDPGDEVLSGFLPVET